MKGGDKREGQDGNQGREEVLGTVASEAGSGDSGSAPPMTAARLGWREACAEIRRQRERVKELEGIVFAVDEASEREKDREAMREALDILDGGFGNAIMVLRARVAERLHGGERSVSDWRRAMSESKGGQQVGPVAQRSRRELDEETRRLREERKKDREAMRIARDVLNNGALGHAGVAADVLDKRLESGDE